MKRLGLIVAVLAVLAGGLLAFTFTNQGGKPRIGIVVPMEHEAMDQMVEGFVTQIRANLGDQVVIDVKNAQGDPLLQKAIIDSFKRRHTSVIAPIGTGPTLMAAHTAEATPIVGLDIEECLNEDHTLITGVAEIDYSYMVPFVNHVFPKVKKITLIHSLSDNVFRQVEQIRMEAFDQGIDMQLLGVQNLADLHVVSKGIADDSDLILILKDHLIVSGITSVTQAAKVHQLPLLTSDEGSVRQGGGITISNSEAETGRQGALIAERILAGEQPADIPLKPLQTLTVYLNPTALTLQGQDPDQIEALAQDMGYPVERVGE